MIEAHLAANGLTQQDLQALPKGACIKVGIARKFRNETTLTLKETASLLHAGNWRLLPNVPSANVSIGVTDPLTKQTLNNLWLSMCFGGGFVAGKFRL